MIGRLVRPMILLGALSVAGASFALGAGLRLLVLAVVGGVLVAAGELAARLEERRRFAIGRHEESSTPRIAGSLKKSQTLDLSAGVLIGLLVAGLSYLLVGLADTGSIAGWPLLALGGAGLVVAVGSLTYLGLPEELRTRGSREPSPRGRLPGRGTRPARPARQARSARSS
jgi:hypothetical protein